MNLINRHNYETFFLEYVDDELSPAMRRQVELFVQQNSDLREELETLLQTKLSPADTLQLDDKSFLLKNYDDINLENYHEHFLLYIDNELEADKKAAVEKFVSQNPHLGAEFNLLQQTVLQPEEVVFTDKSSLYRKEERRVVPFTFMRMAAAASVIAVALFTWWMLHNDSANLPDANVNVALNKNADSSPVLSPENNRDTQKAIISDNLTATTKEPAVKNEAREVLRTTAGQKEIKKEKSTAPLKDNDIAIKKPEIDEKEIELAKIKKPAVQTRINISEKPKEIRQDDKQAEVAAFTKNDHRDIDNESQADNVFAKQAVYKEVITSNQDNDNTFYLGSLELNKNKVHGLIKKVGGLFAGKSKNALINQEGKLQVADPELNNN